jgi:ZIP family zinc transporter
VIDLLAMPLTDLPPVAAGTIASFCAGAMTAVGALPVLFLGSLTARTEAVLMGFGAGVMLAASVFSLILPGMAAAERIGHGEVAAALMVAAGLLVGAGAIAGLHRVVPHEHFVVGREGPPTARLARVWLFVLAITIHNFPEGLAVGVGFGGEDRTEGVALALGIGLQNMPEGLVVALALLTERYRRGQALAVATLSGLVEPLGGLFGAAAVSFAAPALPWGMAFAAGAMLFVISEEIIPETHRHGIEAFGTAGLLAGFSVMMLMDVTLG